MNICKAINSVLAQTYENLEVIVVDDNGIGTSENILTKSIIAENFNDDERVKYYEMERNSGGSLSRNLGIARSSGDYITFLDDDDEYYPEKIKKQLEFYLDNFPNNDGFISCQMSVFLNGKFKRKVKTHFDRQNLLFSAVSEKILGTPSLFIPREKLFSVGLFTDRPKGQEWDLVIKLVENGCLFEHQREALVRVNVSTDSITTIKNVEKKLIGIEGIYLKQKNYFKYFSNREVSAINHGYYIKLANAYINDDIKLSLKLFYKAIKQEFFSFENIRFLAKLILMRLKII